jgi:hypothetical protein
MVVLKRGQNQGYLETQKEEAFFDNLAEKGTRFGTFLESSKTAFFDHFCLHFTLKMAFFNQNGYLKRGQDLGCFFSTSKRGRDLGS